MPLSPLDEDSSADSEKASSSQQTHADLPDDNVEPGKTWYNTTLNWLVVCYTKLDVKFMDRII